VSQQNVKRLHPTRRGLVRTAVGLAAVAGTGLGTERAAEAFAEAKSTSGPTNLSSTEIEPFWGIHQGGITTPRQGHTYAAAFDLVTTKRPDLIGLLRAWTDAAQRMSIGQPAQPPALDLAKPAADSGETLGLSPAQLTLTFGFGATLFAKDGKDRYGLGSQRPPALVDLPEFNGDQLIEGRTGGDLSVQACANDPQVAFHAVRQLARLAFGVAVVRWAQTGFISGADPHQTPRNLMGFKDGISNPSVTDPAIMEKFVWVGSEGPDWMHHGSYVIMRRIRIAIEHWDRMPLEFQQQTFGRSKYSGAPLGKQNEFDPADLDAVDKAGNPVIPDSGHIRLAAAVTNNGAQILRRAYSYNDGVSFTIERWPPWRQAVEYDAGLFFVCYQRDPRTGFIKIFEKLSQFDMLNQFVTHTGGGLFACPGGIAPGEFVGQRLLETS
jgi:deferrochelatase/peroxidase EfeB